MRKGIFAKKNWALSLKGGGGKSTQKKKKIKLKR